MVWSNPIAHDLIPTRDTESFRDMGERETGLPLAPHPGAFGVERKNHIHEGVDLYAPEGTTVRAVEDGYVVGIIPFTGPHADSPWWCDTWAVLVEGRSGVVVYGEIIATIENGITVRAGEAIGHIQRVLRKDKGRPMSMLHLELHHPGTRDVFEWTPETGRPDTLLDPTPLLMTIVDERERGVR